MGATGGGAGAGRAGPATRTDPPAASEAPHRATQGHEGKGAHTMTYGRLIEYEGQMAETFRREVTYPAAARRRSSAARRAIPAPARPLAPLHRPAPSG